MWKTSPLLIVSILLAACSFPFPWERHPIPEITVEQAKQVKFQFCETERLDCKWYYEDPQILDSSYVFYSRMATLERGAAEWGIWIHIKTGKASQLEIATRHRRLAEAKREGEVREILESPDK